jgi:hypothetical protein
MIVSLYKFFLKYYIQPQWSSGYSTGKEI